MDRTYCALQLLSYCFCFFLLYFCFWLSAVLISLTTTSDFQSVSNCIVLCRKNRQNNMTELAHWRVQGDTPMMTIPRSSHVLCTDVCICPADHTDVRREVIAIEMQFVVHRVRSPDSQLWMCHWFAVLPFVRRLFYICTICRKLVAPRQISGKFSLLISWQTARLETVCDVIAPVYLQRNVQHAYRPTNSSIPSLFRIFPKCKARQTPWVIYFRSL